MTRVLEHLYETNGQADFVNMYTAIALQNRGLVSASKEHYRTMAGQFPDLMTTLNASGKMWCERHFANVRARGTSVSIVES